MVRSKNGILFEMRMHWGQNFTNVLNLVALLLFVPGVVFLNIIPDDASQQTQDPYLEFHVTGAVCMACSWFFFAMRVLHFYAINRYLGHWVLMVSKLVRTRASQSQSEPLLPACLVPSSLRACLCLPTSPLSLHSCTPIKSNPIDSALGAI